MQFFVFVLLICLFIFLYCVYVLANDDFIFLRRDVTMEKLFNIIFTGGLISLFFSRLFYGFFHAKSIFSNLLVFLLIPYFPGLSLLGAIVGAGVYCLYLNKLQENPLPLGRMFDFFSIAFLISLPIGFLGYLLFSEETIYIRLGVQAVLYFILFIIFLKFFLPRLLSGKFKEGTISLIFLIFFSIISLILNVFSGVSIFGYFKNYENLILILVFTASVGMLTWYEDLFSKFKQFKKGKQ